MAAIQGVNLKWSTGEKDPGWYTMSVWQNGREVSSYKVAVESGERFSVVWIYSPTEEEERRGARNRQAIEKTFRAGTGYINAVGAMFALRSAQNESQDFIDTPTLFSLLGFGG